jgi:hypothetical protein
MGRVGSEIMRFKATATRAARWLITLTALATVSIMLLPLLAEHSIDQTYSSYLRVTATALTQEPRRSRVIGPRGSFCRSAPDGTWRLWDTANRPLSVRV